MCDVVSGRGLRRGWGVEDVGRRRRSCSASSFAGSRLTHCRHTRDSSLDVVEVFALQETFMVVLGTVCLDLKEIKTPQSAKRVLLIIKTTT